MTSATFASASASVAGGMATGMREQNGLVGSPPRSAARPTGGPVALQIRPGPVRRRRSGRGFRDDQPEINATTNAGLVKRAPGLRRGTEGEEDVGEGVTSSPSNSRMGEGGPNTGASGGDCGKPPPVQHGTTGAAGHRNVGGSGGVHRTSGGEAIGGSWKGTATGPFSVGVGDGVGEDLARRVGLTRDVHLEGGGRGGLNVGWWLVWKTGWSRERGGWGVASLRGVVGGNGVTYGAGGGRGGRWSLGGGVGGLGE